MQDTLIKICGLSSRESIDAAAAAGATHVGFVHYEPSPRHLSLADARALSETVPDPLLTVLLLVSMGPDETARAIDAVQPDVVQLHGAETPEWCAALKQALPIEIWKAVGVRDQAGMEHAQRYVGAVDRILYDAPAGALPGGNGLALDWSLLSGFTHNAPWGLAGGLTPANVADAIRQTKAPLVDTSSGVESAPGIKDIDKIRAFCQAARNG
ncbi:phosphoribosylanthranilate isomerase [Alteraurantiacibacter aestuarii]|uniref:N-(5'-phosphoribosyl)anthranilate isomerase n=1 Tax=Alteraurantiacibacter aestuarii TaxID=650004 RepID=A0A844ZL26_9SPHN|nr:phosphoribosylanthranilate isomerase [Alteraurantiacibacter aestuarii]MXO87710.1 phosphoribosylanthranilate isomerase [Alteraurantiacibacter aestuarii]